MKFYQEITLIDQAEISPYFIWSKLYTQLHIALAEIKDDSDKVGIGASFPQYIFEEKVENQKARVNLVLWEDLHHGFVPRLDLFVPFQDLGQVVHC